MPGISIIVPVWQGENHLERCVNSVLAQSFSDWELLLVDDGSTDATPALCDRFAEADSRVRAFHRERNAGVSEARNLGLREAKGEFIAFLDADDQYDPRFLEIMWGLVRQAGADAAACAVLTVTPDGRETKETAMPAGVYDRAGVREGIVYPLLGERLRQPVFNGYSVRYLYSAAILRETGLTFEGAYLEDELFVLEYFCHVNTLAVTEEALYRYNLGPSSVTRRYMADFSQVFARFMERKTALAERYGLAEARPQWRENSAWAGLLIAIGNEYARDNPKSLRERQRAVEELCREPEMARAIRSLTPTGLSSSKQLVADLVRKGHFFILSQLYRVKNRI